MKKSKLLLVFALLVCSVGQAFGQGTSFDLKKFQATIVKEIMMCPSADVVDVHVNFTCHEFCYDGVGFKNGTDENYWKGKANEVFEQIKKKIEKLDERIAKGKRISADDAYEAAMMYSLGYEPICSLDYQKAMTYFKMAPQTTETNVAMVGRSYKTNKDMKAAAAAMTFTKPSIQAENMATQFGVQKFYQARCNQLSAEFMPQIKRAIRSKDYNTLITYIPYKIKDVDSVLSNIPIDINVPSGRYFTNGIADLDDFSNRNIICYNGKGHSFDLVLFESRDYRAYNPSTESLSGIIDLAESTSDLKQLQVPLQTVFSDKNNITKELSPVAQKSAEDVWKQFQADKTKIYTFIDGLTASNEPKTFARYIPEFINICIKEDGIDIKALKDELKETILPKDPEVATYFGLYLCIRCKTFTDVFDILNMLPHDNEETSTALPPIKSLVTFQDGRIAIKMKNQWEEYNQNPYFTLADGKDIFDIIYSYSDREWFDLNGTGDLILLYNPNGTSCAGYLKNGSNNAVKLDELVATDNPELYIGVTLDKSGNKLGDKYKQYNSYAAAAIAVDEAEQAEAKQNIAAFVKRLKQKYGEKAYNAISSQKYYKGMPIGIFEEYKYPTVVGWLTLYETKNTYFDKERRVYVTRLHSGVNTPHNVYFVHGKLIGWQ